MAEQPWWDWDAEKEEWGWAREPPVSQKTAGGGTGKGAARKKARPLRCSCRLARLVPDGSAGQLQRCGAARAAQLSWTTACRRQLSARVFCCLPRAHLLCRSASRRRHSRSLRAASARRCPPSPCPRPAVRPSAEPAARPTLPCPALPAQPSALAAVLWRRAVRRWLEPAPTCRSPPLFCPSCWTMQLHAGHNFCKPCLEKKFGHIADEVRARRSEGGRGGSSLPRKRGGSQPRRRGPLDPRPPRSPPGRWPPTAPAAACARRSSPAPPARCLRVLPAFSVRPLPQPPRQAASARCQLSLPACVPLRRACAALSTPLRLGPTPAPP